MSGEVEGENEDQGQVEGEGPIKGEIEDVARRPGSGRVGLQ